jgi:hypothetical protein
VVREGVGQGGEMTQALYAHMNNKIILKRNVVFIQNGILFTKNEILSFAGKWMELKNIILVKLARL